jgi:hypothetical protein
MRNSRRFPYKLFDYLLETKSYLSINFQRKEISAKMVEAIALADTTMYHQPSLVGEQSQLSDSRIAQLFNTLV